MSFKKIVYDLQKIMSFLNQSYSVEFSICGNRGFGNRRKRYGNNVITMMITEITENNFIIRISSLYIKDMYTFQGITKVMVTQKTQYLINI